MRMTYLSWMQFYENGGIYHDMEHLTPWRKERGATMANPKMMLQQHSDYPTTRRDVGAKEQVWIWAWHAKVMGSDLGYRVSHVQVKTSDEVPATNMASMK